MEQHVMPIGGYKGRPITEVPDTYLRYLLGTSWFGRRHPAVARAMRAELLAREAQRRKIMTPRELDEIKQRVRPLHERRGWLARAKHHWGSR